MRVSTLVLQFIGVCSIPTIFLVFIWMLTLGSFDLVEAIQHGANTMAIIIFTVGAVIQLIARLTNYYDEGVTVTWN